METLKPIVHLENVSFRFPDEPKGKHETLRGINLAVYSGTFISIVGFSGSGKSTLLRLIADLINPTSGKIGRQYKKLAMIFQSYALFPWLTVLDNVSFGLQMEKVGKEEREKIAREKIKEVGLSEVEHRYPAELSGGQRQRVSIARALSISPDLLLMDEPFSSLDSITAEALKKDIVRIWEKYKMTIIMVNHLLPDSVELSDEIFVLGGSPASIALTEKISLSRPRNLRSNEVFALTDKIAEKIRSSQTNTN